MNEIVLNKSVKLNSKTKLLLKEKACYGIGDFLFYFYTDVALIPVDAIGGIFNE